MPLLRTRFAQPAPATGLVATVDPDASTITLTWDASAETYLEAYRLYAADDAGQDALIYQGTALTYVHGRARLGDTTYRLTVWNGALESDPVSVTATLIGRIPGMGLALVEGSDTLKVDLLLDALSFRSSQVRTVLRPLDRQDPIVRKGAAGLRSGTMHMRVIADLPEQTALLVAMASGDDPVVVKDLHGRVLVVSLDQPLVAYDVGSWEGLDVAWDEVA